jgi:prepilin-type N-terminal cleavage/methylation domain-containing protein
MINNIDRSRRAFSLVEILFAVIIIGVLTAVAIPSLFSQKGKADDSNAKQTVRTVQQLVRTAQDDSGSFLGTLGSGGATMATYLGKGEPDIKFVEANAGSTATGNVRTVSVGVDTSDVVSIAVIGAKDRNNTGKYICWGMKITGDGSVATAYYRLDNVTSTGCTAAAVVGGTTKEGDFPSA